MSQSRNKAFISPNRPDPFSGQHGFHLDHSSVRGPLPFFNPTRATYHVDSVPSEESPSKPSSVAGGEPVEVTPAPSTERQQELLQQQQQQQKKGAVKPTEVKWRARDNRKGRHPLVVDSDDYKAGKRGEAPPLPAPSTAVTVILRGIVRMLTECPYWDVSYLVGVLFSVGCAIFIACGLFSWLPIAYPRSEFKGEDIAADITSFVGATIFQIGAILLVVEACNENQTGCFGWALHEVFEGDDADGRLVPGPKPGATSNGKALVPEKNPSYCRHHHQRGRNKQRYIQPQPGRRWSWWPTWHELTTHYIHEIGFVASATMAVGATIFYVCGICSLPGIYSNMSLGVARGVYWLTYLVGGVLFIISSVLYVLEVQPNWYTPAPNVLGWHIGVWNLIGSVGWTLAAALGYCTADWCAYQSELSLTWASAAFTVGSLLLWYEALDKYPVQKKKMKVKKSDECSA